MAVSALPSRSVSLASTPGAPTASVVSSFMAKVSSLATGGSFTPPIVIVTVATFESTVPSLAL